MLRLTFFIVLLEIQPAALTAIITASAVILGSIIAASVSFWTNHLAHKRQLEIQQTQFRAQMELKARELMFVSYQKRSDENIRGIKELGAKIAELSMVLRLPEIEEIEKMKVMAAFVGTITLITHPIMERIGETEIELKDAKLLNKFESQLSFVKKHLTPELARITPRQVESSYQVLSTALTYIVEIENSLLEKKSLDLFSEYLPQKNNSEK